MEITLKNLFGQNPLYLARKLDLKVYEIRGVLQSELLTIKAGALSGEIPIPEKGYLKVVLAPYPADPWNPDYSTFGVYLNIPGSTADKPFRSSRIEDGNDWFLKITGKVDANGWDGIISHSTDKKVSELHIIFPGTGGEATESGNVTIGDGNQGYRTMSPKGV